MVYDEICNKIQEGLVLNNPGGGSSTIKKITKDFIEYIRGNSPIRISSNIINKVFDEYNHTEIKTPELKHKYPEIFDSNEGGHSCNCTFLFLIFEQANLLEGTINGRGVRGSPFYVKLK